MASLETEESTFVGKEPCPACGSRDNLARYSDGHGHCFGCGHYDPGDGTTRHTTRRRNTMIDLLEGDVRALSRRGISEATCAKFGYQIGKDSRGRTVHIANYRDRATGLDVVAQHLRYPDKEMPWVGDPDDAGLFGQHLWRDGGKRIVVTEGEIDAMSVAQAFNLSWPVVSVKRGAKGATKDLQQSLAFLQTYDTVVLWFDNDQPGKDAMQECAALFKPGTVKIVETPA